VKIDVMMKPSKMMRWADASLSVVVINLHVNDVHVVLNWLV